MGWAVVVTCTVTSFMPGIAIGSARVVTGVALAVALYVAPISE